MQQVTGYCTNKSSEAEGHKGPGFHSKPDLKLLGLRFWSKSIYCKLLSRVKAFHNVSCAMLFSTAAASTHIHTSIRLTNLISLKYSIKDKTIMSAHFCFVYFCTQTAFSMYFITKSVYFTLQTIKHVRHKLNSPKSKEQYNPESHISDSHTLSLAFS